MDFSRISGSYRDPGGHVYHGSDNKIYRTVNKQKASIYESMLADNIIDDSVKAGFLIHTQDVTDTSITRNLNSSYVLQHERVPYISYPYEWSFHELKDAALHHLKFHLYLLDKNYSLSDATAYNIQFIGHKPVFIDLLSIVPYQDGELWMGYKQFFEQFLNPLLLVSLKGIHFNSWYRGALEGISSGDLYSTLSLKQRLNWRVFIFLGLYQKADKQVVSDPENTQRKATEKRKSISKKSYIAMLSQLKAWIEKLEPPNQESVWGDYADINTYQRQERKDKAEVIREFVSRNKINTLVDLGCNTGDYSLAGIDGGAEYVLGFDFDHQALNKAYHRSKDMKLNFLPLWLDASNPGPGQGWLGTERESFKQRLNADGVIALAFEHHLAIGKNIPLDQVVDWITSIADHGIIEFVPKDDPTVKEMLSTREDIFPDYNEASFEAALIKCATIVKKEKISVSGRILYEYKKSK